MNTPHGIAHTPEPRYGRSAGLRALLLACLLTLAAALALSAPAAEAARGHVFGKSFKPEGAHALSEPAGVAVNESTTEPTAGDIYVVDKGNNRVEAFNENGDFQFQLTGPNATGTGTLSAAAGTGTTTEGSETIEDVITSSGAFVEGQSITGTGIPTGTIIAAVGTGSLTLSAPVEAPGGTNVTLTAGYRTVTGILTLTGAFTPGEEIEGEGIPTGTTIETVGTETLELSQPATKAGEPTLTAQQSFASPEAIAIDNTCSLHNKTSEEACISDPSTGDLYITDTGHGAVDKFTATGEYLGQITGLGPITGVGVDTHGDLWVGTQTGAGSFSDAQPNATLTSIGANLAGEFNVPGFAVDSEDDLYLHAESGVIFKVGPNGCQVDSCGGRGHPQEKELLNEEFDPEGSDWLTSELSSSDVYVDHGGSVIRRAADGTTIEMLGADPGLGQLTAGTGVAVSSAREAVFVAEAARGEVPEYGREPPNAPVVLSEGVSNVTGDSATLEGEVNPRSEPDETATEYSFEYGPCTTPTTCASSPFEKTALGGTLSPDFKPHTVTPVNVQDLTAATVYHYRVVATNHCKSTQPMAPCTTEGAQSDGIEVEHTFTTQSAGPFALPDGREWELVSPPDKHGALIRPAGDEGAIQAAATGTALSYVATSPTESEPPGYGHDLQVLSRRGPSGWSLSGSCRLPPDRDPSGQRRRVSVLLHRPFTGNRSACRCIRPMPNARRRRAAVSVLAGDRTDCVPARERHGCLHTPRHTCRRHGRTLRALRRSGGMRHSDLDQDRMWAAIRRRDTGSQPRHTKIVGLPQPARRGQALRVFAGANAHACVDPAGGRRGQSGRGVSRPG